MVTQGSKCRGEREAPPHPLPGYFTYPETHQNMALEGKEAPASGHGFCKNKRWGRGRTQSHILWPVYGKGNQGQEDRMN